ncbi:MAG: CHASE3 domain-containing protein, partial [Ignavibacteriales bacterium]|nr:CHASE3 domain-containing protein [Ignavibacteriales bacterium]
MKKFPFRLRLVVGFSLTLVILILINVVSLRTANSLAENSLWIERSQEGLLKLQRIISLIVSAESETRGYVITGRENYLHVYQTAQETLQTAIQDLRSRSLANPRQQEQLDDLDQLIRQRLELLERTNELR